MCIPTSGYVKEIDICGSTYGNKVDKFELTKFSRFEASSINVPLIKECPVNMECVLEEVVPFSKINILAYVNDEYWTLGKKLGNLLFTRKK